MNREPMKYDQAKYASMRYMQTNRMMCDKIESRSESEGCDCTADSGVLSFAAWELRLYLDTHPWDEKALSAYKKLCEAQGSKCTYACHTDDARGTVDHGHMHGHGDCGCADDRHGDGRVWHWIDDPWPWELAANMKGGGC